MSLIYSSHIRDTGWLWPLLVAQRRAKEFVLPAALARCAGSAKRLFYPLGTGKVVRIMRSHSRSGVTWRCRMPRVADGVTV